MFKIILRVLAALILGLWALLTLIVLLFLYDRWANPGRKSISNVDLVHYGQISLPMLAISVLLLMISLKIKTAPHRLD